MVHPYNKHDALLDRDLTAAERLEPARAALRYAVKLLEQFERETNHAWDGLSDNQLQIICNATEQAWRAAENCAFLGSSGFEGHILERVSWKDN